MPYSNITKLESKSEVISTNYFVDANVWLYALQGDDILSNWQLKYSEFFYKIIESELENRPKILMPTLLFSEIINTYLKQIAMPEYKQIEGIPAAAKFSYKGDYRNTAHYKDSYEKVCDDILGLKSSIVFIDDKSLLTEPPLFLNTDIGEFDLNDFLYYQICLAFQLEQPVILLTNDGDFRITDIPILTANSTLLAL